MPIILTTHARERMRKRKLAESDIELTLRKPDRSFPGKKPGTVKFVKEIDGRNHQVVARFLKDQKSWLILSVWVRGEDDFHLLDWLVMAPFRLIWWVIKRVLSLK